MSKLFNERTLAYAAHPKVLRLPPLEPNTLEQLCQLPHKNLPIASEPLFTRQDLEELADGRISAVFGPSFTAADQDANKTIRFLPLPPLLLVDRVLKLEGSPFSMSKGKICSETDVTEDAWYLHEGHVPPSILVEGGQANLILIYWVGIDLENREQRVYRLLGADVTFHGKLPVPGETIRYEIELDSIIKLGNFRLATFHYHGYVNGELRISIRNAQSGFVSLQQLGQSTGIVWDVKTAKFKNHPRLDPPKVVCQYNQFTAAQVKAFSEGDTFTCFGPGFELAQTHHQSPSIPAGKMRFIDEITHFDPNGGFENRGYIRSIHNISPDDWFFKYHFKNDPCMPGVFMEEGGMQTLYFYLAALGYTLDKDGWHLEPVPEVEMQVRFRGQCTPSTKQIVYEIFIDEIISGFCPSVSGHLLVSLDGLKALSIQNFSGRLSPR